jgi:hypothetical protein
VIHQPVLEDTEFGATRKLVVGDTEGLKTRGDPVNWSVGTAEGCEIRGDSKLHRRQSRRAGRGATQSLFRGAAKGVRKRGNPELHNRQRGRMRKSGRLDDPLPAQRMD